MINTVNPLLCPPGGDGGRIWEWALFNLAKTIVSVLLKELEYTAEKLKYKNLEVMQPRI